jgi:transcriptional regulator with PAS, ATPase and Fis domain
MNKTLFEIESLLETHSHPMMIIGADLCVLAVNQAWENVYGKQRHSIIGRPCCSERGVCRHSEFFKTLEPYTEVTRQGEENQSLIILNNRGFPLLDANGTVYLAESQQVTCRPNSIQQLSSGLVGSCDAFEDLKTKLLQAASMTTPVLLLGETGTGKEVATDFIHTHSECAQGEFVIADCTVFSEDLFESELFGHEKGAFTGAINQKRGLFEIAENGTLFLDEIGELPLSQQAKLLRVIESGQYRRVGGTTRLNANVRIVCATHRNLAEMVIQGLFREDLFYRLSVFPIAIPALRDRKDDIPLLAMHFLNPKKASSDQVVSISKTSMNKLMQHNWPGNIRELRNCIQLAKGICSNFVIEEQDIHFMPRVSVSTPSPIASPKIENLTQQHNPHKLTVLEQYEAEFIMSLVEKHQGNRKLIASEMNVSERTLYRKLSRLNLN